MTLEEMELLKEKVEKGEASEIEELLLLRTLEKGLDELIITAETFPDSVEGELINE